MQAKKALSACAAVVAVSILWPLFRYRRIEKSFQQVADGTSRDNVLSLMGHPWKDERCGEYLGGSAPNCVEEFVFANPLAPLVPEYWVLQFDSEHRVISHEHLQSP